MTLDTCKVKLKNKRGAHCQSDGTQTFLSSTRSGILQYERKVQNLTQNKVCHLKQQNTLCCVPRYCKSVLLSVCMPTLFALGLVISNSTATKFVCKEIHGAEKIGLINIQ